MKHLVTIFLMINIAFAWAGDGNGIDANEIFSNLPGFNHTEADDVMIGDLVWHDFNANGFREGCEPGFAGIILRLTPDGGGKSSKRVSDDQGYYKYGWLPPGDYWLTVDPTSIPVDYTVTTAESIFISIPNTPGTFWFDEGDFGLHHPDDEDCEDGGTQDGLGSIGDYVWYDDNNDRVQDETELGITGVTLNLYVGAEIVATTTTDVEGWYLFDDLAAGDYIVAVDPETIPDGYSLTTGNEPMHIELAEEQDFLDADFGYYKPDFVPSKLDDVFVGDQVWYDVDGDGERDDDEPGIPGVQLTLTSLEDGTTILRETGTDGMYAFQNVAPGLYELHINTESVPRGYDLSTTKESFTIVAPVHDYWFRDGDFGFHNPDDPDPVPEKTNPLEWISGSPTAEGEGWENSIDSDLIGWEGTTTTRGDPQGTGSNREIHEGPAWAIFGMPEHALFTFDGLDMKTDNGIDLGFAQRRQSTIIDVLVSSTGTAPEDFNLVTTIERSTGDMQAYMLDAAVTAKYVKLVIHQPNSRSGAWRQLVEFQLLLGGKTISEPAQYPTDIASLPEQFSLGQNHPNPFNPVTTITYRLIKDINVRLEIYDLTGRKVATLVDQFQPRGQYSVEWNGADMASGVYFYRFTAGSFNDMKRMILLK